MRGVAGFAAAAGPQPSKDAGHRAPRTFTQWSVPGRFSTQERRVFDSLRRREGRVSSGVRQSAREELASNKPLGDNHTKQH